MKKLVYFLVNLMLFASLHAQDPDLSLIPKFLGASSFGKEFWVSIPPCFTDESGGYDNYIKVFVTSQVKTPVFVEVPGKGFQQIKSSVPNDVIEFNILPGVGQPYEKTGAQPYVPEQVFPGAGLHIIADQPIACYIVVRYKYTSDGFLAIPVSALGNEYILAGFNEEGMYGSTYKLPNTTCIVAAFDDTQVEFTLGGNPITRTAGKMKPGESKTWSSMRKGDVLTISTSGGEHDLSGSKVVSNKPVGVTTGTFCTDIPTGNRWCDYTAEMDLPTYTWGQTYVVPKTPYRKYPSIIRIFAKEPNTDIYRDSIKIGHLKYGGGKIDEAYLSMRMSTFSNPPTPPRSVVIRGNKPIGVTLYNTGTEEDNASGNSDPFVMAISPVEQFQNEIAFCTPGIAGSMGFPENYINLVYEANQNGQMPDDFEFGNAIGGTIKWAPLKTKFNSADELLPYKVNGKSFAVKLITLPGDGVYQLRAKKPFAAYSFGYSSYDSYGFPAAARMWDEEKLDSVKPVLSFKELDFKGLGAITGTVTDMPENAALRSNLGVINMHQNLSSNCNFIYDDVIPGQTRTTNWHLGVQDMLKPAVAVISFYDRRGNDSTVILKYNPQSNPYKIRLVSPKDSSIDLKTDLKFIWHKANDILYRLQISESKSFDINVRSFDLTDTFKIVSGLSYSKTYYWRVQSLSSDGVKDIIGSSEIWRFKTESGMPGKVVLTSPVDNTKGLKTQVDFTWDYKYPSLPESYNIHISLDSAFTSIVYMGFAIKEKKTSVMLRKNRDYFWRVNAVNPQGTGAWSDIWKFNVGSDAVKLLLPANNSQNMNQNGQLSWESYYGSKYQLQVATNADFSSTVIDITDINGTRTDYSLKTDTKYFWHVRAVDSVEHDWSEVWSFETVPNPPMAFNLISPPDNSVRQEYNPTLRWTNAGKNIEYQIKIAMDKNLTFKVQEFTTTNEYFTVPLENNTLFYWKVTASNYSGTSFSKEIWSFTTGTILDVAQLNENEPGFKIEPNPASDFIEIDYPSLERGSGGVTIKIYNIFGQSCDLTSALPASGEEVRIDISGLAPGMYFVRIGDRVSKFVKL